MITLTTPQSDENVLFENHGFLVGPIRSNLGPLGDSIIYRSDFDGLTQGRGIYHENDVANLQVKADVTVIPFSGSLSSSPTLDKPNRTKLIANGGLTYYSDYGLASANAGYQKTSTTATNAAFEGSPYDHWVYSIQASFSNPRYTSQFFARHYTVTKCTDGVYLSWVQHQVLNASGGTTHTFDFDLTGPLGTEVITLAKSLKLSGGGAPQLAFKQRYNLGSYTLSMAKVRADVDMMVASLVDPLDFPVPEMHYGDLALKAGKLVDSNNVNMIAFLKDLRKPLELVPKLKNLRNLKTHANNYLTVEYGILPTIDDLKSILASLQSIKPYIDRNGFKTYSAGHYDEREGDDIIYTLEQHVKLAISDDDTGLTQLIEKIDDIGFLPTLENIWDLLPYSFVLDWFVDVGGLLERVDFGLKTLRMGIRYVTSSRKRVTTLQLVPSASSAYSGSIQVVDYQRWVSGQCPLPPLSLDPTFQDFNHWLEAGALLVQRLIKN